MKDIFMCHPVGDYKYTLPFFLNTYGSWPMQLRSITAENMREQIKIIRELGRFSRCITVALNPYYGNRWDDTNLLQATGHYIDSWYRRMAEKWAIIRENYDLVGEIVYEGEITKTKDQYKKAAINNFTDALIREYFPDRPVIAYRAFRAVWNPEQPKSKWHDSWAGPVLEPEGYITPPLYYPTNRAMEEKILRHNLRMAQINDRRMALFIYFCRDMYSGKGKDNWNVSYHTLTEVDRARLVAQAADRIDYIVYPQQPAISTPDDPERKPWYSHQRQFISSLAAFCK
jgi:hypothetical protein